MHRRARHLKGTSIGCNLQLDARYLTDSDGTALSSWADRSANGYSAAQATSTKQPQVRTGSNGINGSTAVNFDGTDDGLQISSFTNNSDMYVVLCVKMTTANLILEMSPNLNSNEGFYVYGQSGNNFAIRRTGTGGYNINGVNNWLGTSPAIGLLRYSYTAGGNYYLNGSVITKVGESGSVYTQANATNSLNIMCRNQSGVFTNGLLGAVIVGSGDLSSPMRVRLQHAMAYSFKIACS